MKIKFLKKKKLPTSLCPFPMHDDKMTIAAHVQKPVVLFTELLLLIYYYYALLLLIFKL